MSDDSFEKRSAKQPKSSQSTYKGTQGYRHDLETRLALRYDFRAQEECPSSIQNLIETIYSHQVLTFSNDMVSRGAFATMQIQRQYRAETGNVSIKLAKDGVQLAENALSWSGDNEDGDWAQIINLVQAFLPKTVKTGIKHPWKLDSELHPGLPNPFLSVFIPDFVGGLAVGSSNESVLSNNFLKDLPKLLEPATSPFPNIGKRLCFPFLIWERKTDAESSLYKAQNQLALPTVKALDILKAVGVEDLSIMALVTQGPKWEFYLGYSVCQIAQGQRRVLRRLISDDLSTDLGAIKFLRLLESAASYVTDVFQPRVEGALISLKQERWEIVFGTEKR